MFSYYRLARYAHIFLPDVKNLTNQKKKGLKIKTLKYGKGM